MIDPSDVLAEAALPVVKELCADLGISATALYKKLGDGNPYPKTIELIEAIGRCAPDQLDIIQADFNARCQAMKNAPRDIPAAEIHLKLSAAMQIILDGQAKAKQQTAIRLAIAALQTKLERLNQ